MVFVSCCFWWAWALIQSIIPRVWLIALYVSNNAKGALAFGHMNFFVNFMWWLLLPWTQLVYYWMFPVAGYEWWILALAGTLEIIFYGVRWVAQEITKD